MMKNFISNNLIKMKRKKLFYIARSYLKLEPCGYCGNVNDENIICYKCFPK